MIGAFKPSAPLFGGLLWKIPWRLSAPQKLRHRRRLRRVDNIVAVLDSALKRQATSASLTTSSQPSHPQNGTPGAATVEDLSITAEGQALLRRQANPDLEARRHGRGPRQGEMLPEHAAHGVQVPSRTVTLSAQARTAGTVAAIERWKAEMPTEAEMLPRDKYTMFDRKAKKYRKGVHKLPKWTRVSQRLNPPGF